MTLNVAVIGVGYLGKFHAEKYAALPNCELVAVVDQDLSTASKIAKQFGTQALSDYQPLIGKVDAVSIATPTSSHYSIAKAILTHGIHVLLEKPITTSTSEADELIQIAETNKCILQIGHLERFNAAVLALDEVLKEPQFIEAHRLAPYKPRATDVNVILDLMIHDIDIILSLVKSDIDSIAASGTQVLSDSIDIANARITFKNGCVANVTASRVSQKSERKMRVFQQQSYISVDFQNRILSHYYKVQQKTDLASIENKQTHFENDDALMTEINAFLRCIEIQQTPLVSGHDGKRALETATQIITLLG